MASEDDRSERYSEDAQMCDGCYDFPDLIQALLNAQMLRSARDGHVDCLRAAIVTGADVNALDVNNTSQKNALIYAVEKQHSDCIGLLVKSGADVNKPDALNRTPLMMAAEHDHDWLVNILIEAGADVNVIQQVVSIFLPFEALSMNGLTALMYAAKSGNIHCLELLLKSGADVNIKKGENYTALTYAGIREEKRMVELLLNAGSDLSGLDEALATVVQQGQQEHCKYLINLGADVNINRGLALLYAAKKGHLKCLKELIEAGADVKQGNATIAAALEGQEKCLKELIKAGADINMNGYCLPCHSSSSTIMNAAHRGYNSCVKLLIETGADVNTCELDRLNLKTLQMLLGAGVKINQATRQGPNALTTLIQSCNEPIHFKLSISEKQQIIRILHAAGETVDRNPVNFPEFPDFGMKINLRILNFQTFSVNMNLQSIC